MIPSVLRMWLIIILLCYFILILFFLKNKAISLKYTLLWLLSGMIMGILVIWPQILSHITRLFGMESNMNCLFILAIGFLMVILMSITSIVSKQSNKIKSLTQTVALLEQRVRELEKRITEEIK